MTVCCLVILLNNLVDQVIVYYVCFIVMSAGKFWVEIGFKMIKSS